MQVSRLFPSRSRGQAALVCAVALCAMLFTLARTPAQASGPLWIGSQIAKAPDGTSRVLWISNTSSGQVVSLWKLDSHGNVLAKTQAYGPYSDSNGKWAPNSSPDGLLVAADGSLSLAWFYTGTDGDKASIWRFDANLNRTAVGPAYGPYVSPNGNAQSWVPDLFVAGPNGTSRLLWTSASLPAPGSDLRKPMIPVNNPGVAIGIWTFDKNGVAVSTGKSYGPYKDQNGPWMPQQLEVGSDGTSRLLWVNSTSGGTGRQASFWNFDGTGVATSMGPAYGPFGSWYPAHFDLNPSDSSIRLLWTDLPSGANGQMASVWTLSSTGVKATVGPAYGPFDSWYAETVYANSDGTSLIEWESSSNNIGFNSNPISFWTLTAANTRTGGAPVYGSYSDWELSDLVRCKAMGEFALLWQGSDGSMSTWSLGANGLTPVIGTEYGPYPYSG